MAATYPALFAFLLIVHVTIGAVLKQPVQKKPSSRSKTKTEFAEALEKDGPPSDSILGSFKQQAVAADAEECSKMGNDILNKGGYAADAAITIALCTGLYHAQSSGIGGGHFFVAYDAKLKNATAIVAREMAPAASSENMFVDLNISSVKGWHAAAVPGEVAGLWEIYKRFGSGKLKWSDLFAPVISLARNGFRVNTILAKAFQNNAEDIRIYENGMADIFIKDRATGAFYERGDQIKFEKLADTMEIIANDPEGIREFYQGKIAKNLVKDIQEGGGIITLEDLKGYYTVVEEALQAKLKDGSIMFGAPPPAGSLFMQHIVKIMDGYGYNKPWKSMKDDEKILFYQRFVEAMKFGYARRTESGDEKFVPEVWQMKKAMVSDWFNSFTRAEIKEDRTSNDTRTYGVHVAPKVDHGTAHFSILDKFGNAVAMTSTINTAFGCLRISKSTGIILNSQMDDFSTHPTEPNYYGLPPSPSNFVQPGKRPQSSTSPTVVVDSDGKVKVVIGASGGSVIISAVAQDLIRVLYLGQSMKEAIDSPRLHHQLLPMRLDYENGFVDVHLKGLKKKGHELHLVNTGSGVAVQGIVRLGNSTIQANCDFRKRGAPAGI